jgi:hypothetical protein
MNTPVMLSLDLSYLSAGGLNKSGHHAILRLMLVMTMQLLFHDSVEPDTDDGIRLYLSVTQQDSTHEGNLVHRHSIQTSCVLSGGHRKRGHGTVMQSRSLTFRGDTFEQQCIELQIEG